MPRYIDADDLRDNVLNDSTYDNDTVNYYLGWIDDAPTADVVPVVRGEWICNPDDKKFSLVCSACGQVMPFIPEYLPDNPPFCNCGADMRGSEVHNG